MRVAQISLLAWFGGGVLLGLIEVLSLPVDPTYSTILQLLPLLLLGGGVWRIVSDYQRLGTLPGEVSSRLRRVMQIGWFAVFGVNAGIASLNNMSTQIFHAPLPYYFEGVSISQKIAALAGVFVLGIASVKAEDRRLDATRRVEKQAQDFWEKPLTNIGFISLLLGVILGLAQYWFTIVFAGFLLLLTGVFLYPLGRLTEGFVESSA